MLHSLRSWANSMSGFCGDSDSVFLCPRRAGLPHPCCFQGSMMREWRIRNVLRYINLIDHWIEELIGYDSTHLLITLYKFNTYSYNKLQQLIKICWRLDYYNMVLPRDKASAKWLRKVQNRPHINVKIHSKVVLVWRMFVVKWCSRHSLYAL